MSDIKTFNDAKKFILSKMAKPDKLYSYGKVIYPNNLKEQWVFEFY